MPAADYARQVPRKPSDGFWKFAVNQGRHSDEDGDLDIYGLTYEKVWVPDTSPAGMFGDRVGKKMPMVYCRCSACGGEELLQYVPVESCDGATYGFVHPDGFVGGHEIVKSEEETLCPMCESTVKAKCMSKIPPNGTYLGGPGYITAETGCMSAVLLEGEPGKRPLALIGWRARRYWTRTGADSHLILPAEAYVFDQTGCVKLMGWHNSYSGHGGYFISYWQEWHQQGKGWHESWGACSSIYGLTADVIEQSCLKNSALLEYMQGGLIGSSLKFPIAYLRMYQKHNNIENLVRQGACHILDELITEQMAGYKWEKNKEGVTELTEICWEHSRPSKMMGLDRDEFAMLMNRMCCAYLWRLYRTCKDRGDRLSEADVEEVFRLGDENLHELAGLAPMGKTVRYLMRQIEIDSAQNEELYACGDEYVPELDDYIDMSEYSMVSATLLKDYWNMAKVAGWNLNLPEVRWPKNLIDAHDGAEAAQKIVLTKNRKALFLKRFKELSVFSFALDGILIRPCRTQTELTQEGEKLKHCVAGYAEDVAKGNKSIFFIRQQTTPKTPWYTLQFDPEKLAVVQNHGYKNDRLKPIPQEVNDFVDSWLTWVKDGCKRDDEGNPVIKKTRKKKEVTAA